MTRGCVFFWFPCPLGKESMVKQHISDARHVQVRGENRRQAREQRDDEMYLFYRS